MSRWLLAVALSLLSVCAQAQNGFRPSYLPQEFIKEVVSPDYSDRSLIHRIRFPRGGSVAAPTFNGNPNLTISGITGSFATSRDSDSNICEVPCAVQSSAAGITATGTSAAYEDLSYSWNYGAGCGDTFIRPTDGATVCAGTDQRGPESANIYRTPGNYVITLTVTGCAGTIGTPNTANQGICTSLSGPTTFTKNITVNPFSGADQYADQNGTPAGEDGTQAHPWTTLAQINTALSAGNVAMHIKPNSHWVSSTVGLKINPGASISKIRVDAIYPGASGAAPIIETITGSEAPLRVLNGGGSSPAPVADVVISGINFLNTSALGVGVAGMGGNDTAAIKNFYLDNVSLDLQTDSASIVFNLTGQGATGAAGVGENYGLWKVTNNANTAFTNVDIGELGSASNWHFRMGGSVTGPGVNTGLSHHIYNEILSHGLYQWVTCGPTGTGVNQRGYCFNGNYDGATNNGAQNIVVQYVTYNENSCQYTIWCVDLGNRVNNQYVNTMVGDITGTKLTVTSFTINTAFLTTTSTGSNIINVAGTVAANTHVVGDAFVNSGACTPACTGTGATGTYAVSVSQTVAPGSAMQSADSTVQYQYVVISGNAMIGTQAINYQCGLSVTQRDNRMWSTPATFDSFFALPNASIQRAGFKQGGVTLSKFYRNKAYFQSSSDPAGPIIDYQGSWTVTQYVTDNWFVDNRTSGKIITVPWTDMLASGSVIARNVYSQMAGNTSAWFDVGTSKTFTDWQNAGTTPSRWDPSPAVNLGTSCPSGWTCPVSQWSHMNFLLKRDIDPASNDNNPMWLEKAA